MSCTLSTMSLRRVGDVPQGLRRHLLTIAGVFLLLRATAEYVQSVGLPIKVHKSTTYTHVEKRLNNQPRAGDERERVRKQPQQEQQETPDARLTPSINLFRI